MLHPRILVPSLVSTLAGYTGLIPIVAINGPGSPTNKEQCYVKALEIDPKYALAWNNLGTINGGTVDGKRYSKDQRALDGRLPS